MKKIFFIALLFQTIQLSPLQAFFEFYNDTKGTVLVEVQFNKHGMLDSCPAIKRELRPGQQRLKINQPGGCNNNSISFTTTDEKGVQRKATLSFIGSSVFDPGITTFKDSSNADYWFALKSATKGEYVIKIPTVCTKSVNNRLKEQGFTPSTIRGIFGSESALSKTGKFTLE